MGIRGLQTFIEREHPDVLETVNIKLCAQEYAQRNKCDPVLLISGSAIFFKLYQNYETSVSHLCLIDKLGLDVQQLINRLYAESNIKCILYFERSPALKESSYIENRKWDAANLPRIVETLESKKPPQDIYKEYIRRFSIDIELVKHFLRLTKCDIYQFEGIDDKEVVKLYSQYKCFALLAQDSDYLIMEGIENYFSVNHLDESGLQTKAYRRNIFAKSLGFDERFLPIFASLCPNDYVSDEDLRDFHLYLFRDNPNLMRQKYFHKKLLMTKVGHWVSRHSFSFDKLENIPKVVADLIHLPDLEEKISRLLHSYSLHQEPLPLQMESSTDEDDDWLIIVGMASMRYKCKGLHRDVWDVLSHKKHFTKSNFLSAHESQYPCFTDIMGDLLCRIYGILLKECTQGPETPVVQFYCFKKNLDYSPSVLRPTFPPKHPGLLYLWGDCPINEKLQLLCWIISDKLKPSSILSIPEELRIASLALFYLVNEGKYNLESWQVEALIGQLVCLSQSVKLSQRKARPLKGLEIHISSLYMAAWSFTAMADDACGNPLQVKGKTVIFDGVIFNKLFYSMKRCSTVSGVSDLPLHKYLREFLSISKP